MTKNLRKSIAVSKEQALSTFMGQIGEINELLAELQDFADDHLGYSPEDVTWGHVGTANYFLERLNELADFAFKRGEHEN